MIWYGETYTTSSSVVPSRPYILDGKVVDERHGLTDKTMSNVMRHHALSVASLSRARCTCSCLIAVLRGSPRPRVPRVVRLFFFLPSSGTLPYLIPKGMRRCQHKPGRCSIGIPWDSFDMFVVIRFSRSIESSIHQQHISISHAMQVHVVIELREALPKFSLIRHI